MAIQTAIEAGGLTGELATIIIGGLLILFSMWWLYFDRPGDWLLSSNRLAFLWGYGHFPVFASVAAVGAGLAVGIDHAVGSSDASLRVAGAAVAVPVALYLVTLWSLHVRRNHPAFFRYATPGTALLVLATPFTPFPVLAAGILVAGLTATKTRLRLRGWR